MLRRQSIKHSISDINLSVANAEAKLKRRQRKHNLSNILPGLSLTVYQAEKFCALDLSKDELAIENKRQVAEVLAKYFKRGGKQGGADEWKAKQYALLANRNVRKEEESKIIEELNSWNLRRTQHWTAIFGWFNALRLSLIRINRIGDSLGNPFIVNFISNALDVVTDKIKFIKPAIDSIKKRVLSIGGFYFIFELALEVGVLLKHVFKPDPGEKHLHWHQRLYNAWCEDLRWHRILNAAVWLAVNVAAFVLTGGISAILNICGFSFDPINELIHSWVEIKKNKNLLDKINKKLHRLENILTKFAPNEFELRGKLESNIAESEQKLSELTLKIERTDNKILAKKLLLNKANLIKSLNSAKQQLESVDNYIKSVAPIGTLEEYKKYRLIKAKQEESLTNLKLDRFRVVCVALGVLVGMALLLFPPAGIPVIAGALTAFIAGSIIGGLGIRIYKRTNMITGFFKGIYNKIKDCCCSSEKMEAKVTVQATANPRPIPPASPKPTHLSNQEVGCSYASIRKNFSNRDLLEPLLSEPRTPTQGSINSQYVPPTLPESNAYADVSLFGSRPSSLIVPVAEAPRIAATL